MINVRKSLSIIGLGTTLFLVNTLSSAVYGQAVRKNATTLTSDEIARFVNALDTIKNTTRPGSTIPIYDEFVALHDGVFSFIFEPSVGFNITHGVPAFAPWHREYLIRFENALQSVDPSVTIPYWDWTDPNALDFILSDNFLGNRGTGETITVDGVEYTGGKVTSGVVADWVLDPRINIQPIGLTSLGTDLKRFVEIPPFDRYPVTQKEINDLLSIDNYLDFRGVLEGEKTIDDNGQVVEGVWRLHNYLHGVIGGALVTDVNAEPIPPNQTQILGTMNSILSSPYDPIFWLHHANVDRLWASWQVEHPGADFYPSSGQGIQQNLDDPMWPWDGGQLTPSSFGPFADLLPLYPTVPNDDIVTPRDVLDAPGEEYVYDQLASVVSVPEPTMTFGLLGFAAMAIRTKLQRQAKNSTRT
ncbi:MAG: tyrosinase family protein [Crocosphaera sp.]